MPGPSANPLSNVVGVAFFRAELQFAGTDTADRAGIVRLKADTTDGRPEGLHYYCHAFGALRIFFTITA